jgi:hypothetical protein
MHHWANPAHYIDTNGRRLCFWHRRTVESATILATSERDSAGCWCELCTPQGDITQLKGDDHGISGQERATQDTTGTSEEVFVRSRAELREGEVAGDGVETLPRRVVDGVVATRMARRKR